MAAEGRNRDQRLKKDIESALGEEKDFSGYDINVRVVDGNVTIYGIVDTLADKEHAGKVAAAVSGVEKIENDLTVSTDGAIDDRDVYREVRQELNGDPRLEDTMIKIKVNKGRLTLGGEVENTEIKEAAVESAQKAMGVKEIADDIKVKD